MPLHVMRLIGHLTASYFCLEYSVHISVFIQLVLSQVTVQKGEYISIYFVYMKISQESDSFLSFKLVLMRSMYCRQIMYACAYLPEF